MSNAALKQPVNSIMRKASATTQSAVVKKVFFDEIMIKEYPLILGDNPAVSCGAPVTIGWKPSKESVVDLDFYEYCRASERRNRKKMMLSVRKRAGFLLASGYSLEEIADATLEAERTKKMRAESLKSAGWSNPWEMLSGAVETTGSALKKADVLGVGAVVGAGVQGVNTVVGVGADVTVQTGRLLVNGAKSSTRAVTGVATDIAGGVVGAGRAVGKNLIVKPVGKLVSSTGRAMSFIVNPNSAEKNRNRRRRSMDNASLSDFAAVDVQ